MSKDDLYHFQIKHFHQSPSATIDRAERGVFQSSEDEILAENGVLNEEENEEDGTYFEDDDGLGYYPDGVKRTLTDEQIAMFRHSEIYALFRKQQIQNEACDMDETVNSGPLDLGSTPTIAIGIGNEPDIDQSDDNDEEEYLKFLEEEGKQIEEDRKQMETERKTKKRKFGRVNGSKPHDRAPTHRRIARELDDAITSYDVLNYDDENAESLDPPEEPSRSGEDKGSNPKGSISEPSKTVSTTPATTPNDRPKGRKIWWPTIGKPAEILP